MTKRRQFYDLAPGTAFFLDTDVKHLGDYLGRRGWLETGECILDGSIAGQGNMNCIVRVTTSRRTFILKQSRPWVEKYPEIPAPFNRALVEAEFYKLVSGTPAAEFMPKLNWIDGESRLLCLEDLGALCDFTDMYGGLPMQASEQERLCLFLSTLHRLRGSLPNREMRALNHQHIFALPFMPENKLDLDRFTPGLRRLAEGVKANRALGIRIAELGKVYLSGGDFLLHGDYFPGSWLRSASGVKVIDPEFGFSGMREFDLGVMLAHLLICGSADALASLASSYAQWNDLDQRLVRGFAGVEVLRRLLGVAQLPLGLDLRQKQLLIEQAVSMVLA